MDLQLFCGNEPDREYLQTPFSHGGFTYATNGHIMVRVPQVAGVRKQTKDGTWDAPMKGLPEATFSPLAHNPLPDHPLGPCTICAGEGYQHDCPDCSCACPACKGSGNAYPDVSTTVRGHIFALRYVAMMLALPGVEIADKTGQEMPLLFKFDGGFGALMPRRSRCTDHIEIETAKAA